MTRFLIILIFLTLLVTVRLLFLRMKMQTYQGTKSAPPVIEGRTVASGLLELKSCEFENFDAATGPKDWQEFFERMRVTVARPGSERVSSFMLYVTTPKGLAEYLKREKTTHQFGRDLLVVERYDMDVIRAAVEARLDDLPHIADQIG